MPNNKYSIMYVHESIFSQLKNVRRSSENGQLVALESVLVAQCFVFPAETLWLLRIIHSSNELVSHIE